MFFENLTKLVYFSANQNLIITYNYMGVTKLVFVYSRSFCCYGNLLCQENDNNVGTNDWPFFNVINGTFCVIW